MTIFLATLLVAASVTIVLYPLWRHRGGGPRLDDPAVELRDRLRRARDRTYQEILALQQERFMQDLSDEEYRARLDELRLHAANLIRQQNRMQDTLAEIEDTLEDELHKRGAGDQDA